MSALIPYNDMQAMAQDIASSGLFGMKQPNQVLALMAVAQAEGKHPAIVARDFDIIQGRPAKKSEAMLRDFIASGGRVEWHRLDDTCADATFSHPQGGSVRIDWTMDRAKVAGLLSKDMYKKFPRQMLRARTISEGVRTVAPLATSGFYAPEEVHTLPAGAAEIDMGPAQEVATKVSDESRKHGLAAINLAATLPELKSAYMTAYKLANVIGDQEAIDLFTDAKNARKAEFERSETPE